MATISRDNPCLSITSVAHDRLPVFRTDALRKIVCAALDEAAKSLVRNPNEALLVQALLLCLDRAG